MKEVELGSCDSSNYCRVRLFSQVDVLKTYKEEKENYIQKLLLDLSQTQKEFTQLQNTASKALITSVVRLDELS